MLFSQAHFFWCATLFSKPKSGVNQFMSLLNCSQFPEIEWAIMEIFWDDGVNGKETRANWAYKKVMLYGGQLAPNNSFLPIFSSSQ